MLKMKGKIVAVICFFLLLLGSCTSNERSKVTNDESELDILYSEVMEIHDNVMPKMSDINNSKDQINEILSSNQQQQLTEEQIQEMKIALSLLKEAEDAMWDWMHSFSDMYGQMKTEKEKELFLTKEKESISKVRDLMEESIENAKQFIIN